MLSACKKFPTEQYRAKWFPTLYAKNIYADQLDPWLFQLTYACPPFILQISCLRYDSLRSAEFTEVTCVKAEMPKPRGEYLKPSPSPNPHSSSMSLKPPLFHHVSGWIQPSPPYLSVLMEIYTWSSSTIKQQIWF